MELLRYAWALLGVGILSRAVRSWTTPRSHWFALHAAANAMTCMLCVPALTSLSSTEYVFAPVASRAAAALRLPWDAAWVAALHAYHLLFFPDATREDWLHHLLFVPYSQCLTLAPYLWGWPLQWGAVLQLQHFFVCGLPGMIDYACLALRREQRLAVLPQKRIQVKVNVWLRVPGILTSCALLVYEAAQQRVPAYVWVAVLSNVLLIGGNALYYAERVVRAYPPPAKASHRPA